MAKTKTKRKVPAAFNKEFSVKPEAQAVLGKKTTRAGMMKNFWAYVKKKGLNEGRTIHTGRDPTLKKLFGKNKIDSFKDAPMRVLNQHIK